MKNRKQMLIVLSSIFYIVSLVLVYLVSKNPTKVTSDNKITQKEVLTSQINDSEQSVTPTQSEIVKPINEMAESNQVIIQSESRNGYTIKSIQDNQNSISKLILINNKNEEIIIDEWKYYEDMYTPGVIIKPEFSYTYTPDNDFIIYQMGIIGGAFNPKYQRKVEFDLDLAQSEHGFDIDGKYFYICDDGCMGNCGVAIYSTVDFSLAYYEFGQTSCQFNKTDNSLTISTQGFYNKSAKKTFDFKAGFLNSN